MSWTHEPRNPEHNHIDGRTQQHNIRLVNHVTGGEHLVHILLGVHSCPTCGTVFPQDSNGDVDVQVVVEQALHQLQVAHERLMDHAARHGVPIVVGPLHSRVPNSHRVQEHKGRKLLTQLQIPRLGRDANGE